jgi:hypothetical protein
MWIMVIKELPVEEQYKPDPLSIHWALPWDNQYKERIKKMIFSDENIVEEVCDYLQIKKPYLRESIGILGNSRSNRNKCKNELANIIDKHTNQIVDLLSEKSFFYDNIWGGKVPNRIGKKRIIVNNEPVGIYPHEYSEVSHENMATYINEEVHTFVPAEVASEEIGLLTKLQKLISDQAQTDGCTLYQSQLVAVGRDPLVDFPPPLGWYKCREDYKHYFGF